MSIEKPYLDDSSFLREVDLLKKKTLYTKIVVLDWHEEPIKDIIGITTQGSVNIDGTSAVRRTCNLTVAIKDKQYDFLEVNNFLALNKKVKIEIGIENTLNKYKDFDILWFPLGLFVIVGESINHNESGLTATLQLKDKMCLLNGEVGGIIPAPVVLNKKDTIDATGNKITEYPTIHQIIQEVVNHYGGEQLAKIIISDLDTRIEKVMKWTDGDRKIYINMDGDSLEKAYHIVGENEDPGIWASYPCYSKNQDLGLSYTDFTYPDNSKDYAVNAGATVTSVLDHLKGILGNYEYFYDLDGNFRFQEIKNYLNISKSTFDLSFIEEGLELDYSKNANYGNSIYNFDDATIIKSYSHSPQYNMIKNDFVIWGKRKENDIEIAIKYHLAIDDKPIIKDTHKVIQIGDVVRPVLEVNALPAIGRIGVYYYYKGEIKIWDMENNKYITLEKDSYKEVKDVLSTDWRNEFFLGGYEGLNQASDENYYFVELQEEWPKIYDVIEGHYKEKYLEDNLSLTYFLDIIDNSSLSDYSVSSIGRRSKVVNDNNVNCVFEPEINNLIICQNDAEVQEAKDKQREYIFIEEKDRKRLMSGIEVSNFTKGGKYYSAYYAMRDLLYEYTQYSEAISLQCIPIYHLEPNTIIYVDDEESGIHNNYLIKSISIPLDVEGLSSISATKILDKI